MTIGQGNINHNSCHDLIGEGAVLCSGAKIFGKLSVHVGKNTIIAANYVLLCSIGDGEVWVGVPVRVIKKPTRQCEV